MRRRSSPSSASWRRDSAPLPPSWPACGPCLGWPPRSSRTGWRNGDGCCAIDDAGAHGAAAHSARAVDVHAARIRERRATATTSRGRRGSTSCSRASPCERPKWADMQDLVRDAGRGCEHIGTEDTFDGDYGRLLDRVLRERGYVPSGIRTRVTGVKGRRPGPLDDGDASSDEHSTIACDLRRGSPTR